MLRLSRMILFCCMFALFGLLMACTTTEPGSCKDAAQDCQVGQKCCKADGSETGTCKASCDTTKCETACREQSDCLNGQTCTDGCCKSSGPDPGKECKRTSDCPKSQECTPSGGKKICTTCAQTCVSTTDCSGGDQVCENGCCRLPSCTADSDCSGRSGNRNFCDKDSGDCVSCLKTDDCSGSLEVCKQMRCVKVECKSDNDCADPTPSCNTTTNKCQKAPICTKDDDCRIVDPSGQLAFCDTKANGGLGACKKAACVTCSSDDECGDANAFCVTKDQGLKDGPRCLFGCKNTKDCPTGFVCSDAIVSGFKVCFPNISFCEDPCKTKQCGKGERCVEGKCELIPAACNPCSKDSECPKGGRCAKIGAGNFCTAPCQSKTDCPTSNAYECLNGECIATDDCKK